MAPSETCLSECEEVKCRGESGGAPFSKVGELAHVNDDIEINIVVGKITVGGGL